METEKKLQLLQMIYAGALADFVNQLGKEGVLDSVAARKKAENMVLGKTRATQFGITSPEEVFTRLSDLFNCVKWTITGTEDGFTAEGNACMLCGIAKKIGAPSPCNIYCLDPMEAMVKGLDPDTEYTVKETLWDGQKCLVEVRKAN